ncbi:MAG: efflux RND transporter periplasmic adaptor subunit [Desulfobacteraceae bacterium]
MSDNMQLSVNEAVEQAAINNGRKRLIRWIAGIFLVVAIGAVAVAGNLRGGADPVRFQTEPVRSGNLEVTVTATGNLEATNQVDVGSELSGIILRMTADYNDTVTAGQPLVYLDDAKYKAAVMKSRAGLASAEAGYKEAVATRNANKKILHRYRVTHDLTNGKLPSVETLESAEADLERSVAAADAAAAAVDVATAELNSDLADLKKTVIYAPINGIVLSRDVEPGQTVAASLEAPVLYTLAEDLRHMELQVDVDEADVGQVRQGQVAAFSVDAYPERTFAARITQVRYGAETTDGVVTYKTVMRVENPDLLLRPGMTATATITVLKIENALLVPNAALRFSPVQPDTGKKSDRGVLESLMPGPPPHPGGRRPAGGGQAPPHEKRPCVWVLKDNHPMPVPVDRGQTDGVSSVVRSEQLQAGTRVIVSAMSAEGQPNG